MTRASLASVTTMNRSLRHWRSNVGRQYVKVTEGHFWSTKSTNGSFVVTSDHSGSQGRGVELAKSQRRRKHLEVEAAAASAACLCLTETGTTHSQLKTVLQDCVSGCG